MQYPSFLRKLNPLCFTFPKKQYILSYNKIFPLRGKSREVSFNIFFDVSATFSEYRVHSFYEVSKRASRQQVVTISKSAPPARDVKGHAVDLTRSFGIGREKEHSPRHAEKEKEEKREKEREKRKEPASRRRFLYRRLDTLLSSGREAKQNKGLHARTTDRRVFSFIAWACGRFPPEIFFALSSIPCSLPPVPPSSF